MRTHRDCTAFLVPPVILWVVLSTALPVLRQMPGGAGAFWAATGDAARLSCILFALVLFAVQVPFAVLVARLLPRRGRPAAFILALVALALMLSWGLADLIREVVWHGHAGLPVPAAQNGIDRMAVIAGDVWRWTPLVVLLCHAGLRSIPDISYQAARLDGASRWTVFRFIELPHLRRMLAIALLLRLLDCIGACGILA